MSKRSFIKDPVWGNTEIFEWEKELLNHFLLNRLHNVVQTSCAFRVYPGLRHSRFSHSIGVMHVATQMFANLVTNSSSEALEQLRVEREGVEGTFGSRVNTAGVHISKSVCSVTSCPDDWAVLLASIRVAALLHDIGHLPYSHVFEFALQSFLDYDLGVYDSPTALREQQTALRTKLAIYQDSEEASACGKGPWDRPHESLARNFIYVMIQDLRSMPGDGASPVVQACLLTEAANEILNGPSMPISHSLIAGVLDADRIDFVRRDSLFSGLLTSSVDYNRLFSTYELRKKADGEYAPCPSLRAASEAEKLLWERFLEYKYVAAHHKVHFFDELLERLIYHLMLAGRLSPFLSNLRKLLQFGPQAPLAVADQVGHARLKQELLTQFDDPWLEHEIREGYRQSTNGSDEDRLIRFLFESLVEDRDRFRSLFKRDDEYHSFVKEKGPRALTSADETEGAEWVAMSVRVKKYEWEIEISESLNQETGSEAPLSVIIGDSSSKITDGFGQDKSAADFFRLSELREFLQHKIASTMPFNLWYIDQGTIASSGVETKDWIEDQIADRLRSIIDG